jgi:hypothetical protein
MPRCRRFTKSEVEVEPHEIQIGDEVVCVAWPTHSTEPRITLGKVTEVGRDRLAGGADLGWEVTVMAANANAALRRHLFKPDQLFRSGSEAGAFIAAEASDRIRKLQRFVDDPLGGK